jgi:hypothetical protein
MKDLVHFIVIKILKLIDEKNTKVQKPVSNGMMNSLSNYLRRSIK